MSTGAESDALAALAASRERLRAAMVRRRAQPKSARAGAAAKGEKGDAAAGDDEHTRREGALWRYWRRKVNDSAALTLLVESAQSWWQLHPWRQIGHSVLAPLGEVATPLVRRYPWPAVALAVAAGAGVVAARPWRWGFVTRQMRPMPSRAMHWLMAQATSPAGQVVLASLMAGLIAPAARAAADAVAGSGDDAAKPDAPATTPTAAASPAATPVPQPAPAPTPQPVTTD